MIKFGINVSQHQGTIDWDAIKDQIDFVIIRCGYGKDSTNQDDAQFHRNIDACTRLNIPFGVYIYSYAKKVEDAIEEAKHVLRLVRGYKLSYPIYYHLEDASTIAKQTKEDITRIAEMFCTTLEKKDYCVGICADIKWWHDKLIDKSFNKYSKWIISHSEQLHYTARYDIWQYSNHGNIEGMKNDVCLNYSYRDYANIIPKLGKNGFSYLNDEDITYRYRKGDIVRFHHVFLTSESKTPLKPYRDVGTITKIKQKTRNPYLVGLDQGWVNDQVIEGKARYLKNTNYVGTSFSNALSQIKENASFENRSRIASLNGIYNYQGTTYQNEILLNLLKQGKLIVD